MNNFYKHVWYFYMLQATIFSSVFVALQRLEVYEYLCRNFQLTSCLKKGWIQKSLLLLIIKYICYLVKRNNERSLEFCGCSIIVISCYHIWNRSCKRWVYPNVTCGFHWSFKISTTFISIWVFLHFYTNHNLQQLQLHLSYISSQVSVIKMMCL